MLNNFLHVDRKNQIFKIAQTRILIYFQLILNNLHNHEKEADRLLDLYKNKLNESDPKLEAAIMLLKTKLQALVTRANHGIVIVQVQLFKTSQKLKLIKKNYRTQ